MQLKKLKVDNIKGHFHLMLEKRLEKFTYCSPIWHSSISHLFKTMRIVHRRKYQMNNFLRCKDFLYKSCYLWLLRQNTFWLYWQNCRKGKNDILHKQYSSAIFSTTQQWKHNSIKHDDIIIIVLKIISFVIAHLNLKIITS